MIALLVALALPQADPAALMKAAGARLSAADATAEPADPSAAFRVRGDGAVPEQRARAVDATGTSCGTSVRLCTRPPRTWLSAPIGD